MTGNDQELISDGDEVPNEEEDDPLCSTIRLMKEEKRRIREPWKNSLIIKMFDKNAGYLQLMECLKQRWNLRGNFSLIDIRHAYFIARFDLPTDHDHVLANGPWLINDHQLTIRKWVPNFIANDGPIHIITAWVRISRLSVEYFNAEFLQKIGNKTGTIRRVDDTTASAERGQFVRLSVEIDLRKPLLSKFRMNRRIWKIQYEGLKIICFKCEKYGVREEKCDLFNISHGDTDKDDNAPPQNPSDSSKTRGEEQVQDDKYGTWMIVKKPARKKTTRNQRPQANMEKTNKEPNGQAPNREERPKHTHPRNLGSRFEMLNAKGSTH